MPNEAFGRSVRSANGAQESSRRRLRGMARKTIGNRQKKLVVAKRVWSPPKPIRKKAKSRQGPTPPKLLGRLV